MGNKLCSSRSLNVVRSDICQYIFAVYVHNYNARNRFNLILIKTRVYYFLLIQSKPRGLNQSQIKHVYFLEELFSLTISGYTP